MLTSRVLCKTHTSAITITEAMHRTIRHKRSLIDNYTTSIVYIHLNLETPRIVAKS